MFDGTQGFCQDRSVSALFIMCIITWVLFKTYHRLPALWDIFSLNLLLFRYVVLNCLRTEEDEPTCLLISIILYLITSNKINKYILFTVQLQIVILKLLYYLDYYQIALKFGFWFCCPSSF